MNYQFQFNLLQKGLFLTICLPLALLSSEININASNQSFNIPISVEKNFGTLTVFNKVQIFTLNYPLDTYTYQQYNRNNVSMVTEQSYFRFNRESFNIQMGRSFNSYDSKRMNGVFNSSVSPSLDQIKLNAFSKNFNYSVDVISLDSQSSNLNVYNRWFYHRRIGLTISERLNIGFHDAVVATGVKRGIDMAYLAPLTEFQLEQLQGSAKTELGYQVGGNNDNILLGFDWEYTMPWGSFYNEWVIDEFQIDSAGRENVQDVFGLVVGAHIIQNDFDITLEYAYASPWLYLNGGMFTNYEFRGYPMGLRSPHSQSLDMRIRYEINEKRNIQLQLRLEQCGEQSFDTVWDSPGNFVPFFDFKHTLKPEFYLTYTLGHKWLNHISVTNNWLETDGFYFLLGFNLYKSE